MWVYLKSIHCRVQDAPGSSCALLHGLWTFFTAALQARCATSWKPGHSCPSCHWHSCPPLLPPQKQPQYKDGSTCFISYSYIYITYHFIAHARCFEWKMFPQHWNSATLSLAFRFWSVIFINTSTRFQRKSTDTWKQTDTVKTNGLWAPSCKLPRLVSRQLLSFESSWKVFYKMVVMAGF